MVSNENTETTEDEVLVPSVANRVVTFGTDGNEVSYVQKPLSFFGKIEVFSVLGSALDKAMSGPDGLTLNDVFEGPTEGGISAQRFRDADTFVKGVAKLVQYAPDLLEDLYTIFLGVPRGERELVKFVMVRPADEGGLSDEDGLGILDTFVDQNWDVMLDFFTSRVMPLVNKVSTKVQESQPSKPSKNTPRTTRKR